MTGSVDEEGGDVGGTEGEGEGEGEGNATLSCIL